MFHSSGFFSGMLCPFYEHGLCYRPYCHYRHSRRERPPPRKRPQLKTKYTSYPSTSTSSESSVADPSRAGGDDVITVQGEGSGVRDGEGGEGSGVRDGEGGEGCEASVLNFYGATKRQTGGEEEEGKECEDDQVNSRVDIGTDSIDDDHPGTAVELPSIDDDQPGTAVELPSYAPEVCAETMAEFREPETISENMVKDYPLLQVDNKVAGENITMETELPPPTVDDVTEADIFGSTDDEVANDVEMEEEEEEEEKEEEVKDEMKSVFQSAIETQATGTRAQSQKRKSTSSEVEYRSLSQKKRRLALPNAEIYRKNATSAVKSKAKVTTNFAATLDKEALYMGKKRVALTPNTAMGHSKSKTSSRPVIPLKANSKVPTKLRQKYLDAYIDEILKVTLDPHVAYEKARKEEEKLFQNCSSRMTYCSRASQVLQRLRKEARDFLEKQRETSDTRVRAHNVATGGQGVVSAKGKNKQTTPTVGQGVEPAEKGKKQQTTPTGVESAKGKKKQTTPTGGKGVVSAEKGKKKKDRESACSQTQPAKKTQLTQLAKKPPPPKKPRELKEKENLKSVTSAVFCSKMQKYLLTPEQLLDNGYPQATMRVGVASINWGRDTPTIQPVGANAMRHRCCRCGKPFIIYNDGEYQTVEDCIYHFGRLIKVKEYGEGIVSEYSCCNERSNSGGCQVAKFHVTAGVRPREVEGYVQTTPSSSNQTVYAVDCEMCYTTAGLELTRVSVVDMELRPVYETIVRPPHTIVDYNTRFSGLCAEDFVSVTTTLEEVQQRVLSLVDAGTILLGHSLESDLRALKIIHNSVVDTAIVFPHRKGPPFKRALRNLMKEHMRKFIQDSVDGGHDSLEDAQSCMELMVWKVKSDFPKDH